MTIKKRRLADLYTVGREITFNDESGEDPVVVWIQKLSVVETESAARRAGAAKARVLIEGRDKSSEEYGEAFAEVADLPRETLVDIAIADDFGKAMQSADAEISAEDQWVKDGYLQGLRDSWDELRGVYESGDEDHEDYAEAARVFGELKRFDAQVDKRLEGERIRLQRDTDEVSTAKLQDMVIERNALLRADTAWIREYRRSQIFFGVREQEDHRRRYFSDRAEVDDLSAELINRLYVEFDRLNVDSQEGKDLPLTPISSEQSGQSGEVATADSSGLTDAPQ